MHRSGTSALTRVLTFVGCEPPRTLMEPTPDNARGYWESQPVADLNDALLGSAGTAWHDWRPFDPGWYASPVAGEFRERAHEVLRKEFGDSRLFVVKDPRICRLLAFWVEAIGAFGARAVVVSTVRNPLDVAASLRVRDGMDPFVGYLSWLRNVLDAEAASRALPRAYVRYARLLGDAQACVAQVGAALGIAWPRRPGLDTAKDIDAFLTPELRHHRSGDMRLVSNPRIPPWVRNTFTIVDRWTQGEARPDDLEALDRIRSAFDEATPAFSRALAASQKEARALAAELEATRRTVGERDERIAALAAELGAARADAAGRAEPVAARPAGSTPVPTPGWPRDSRALHG